MNDDFEKRLSEQPLRKIPADWRAKILSAATENRRVVETRASWSPLGWLEILWRELVWPSRRAWAALAAAWVLIAVVNLRETRNTELANRDFTPPSPAVLMALREPERWLAEFTEPHEAREADRPKKILPMPRSEWHNCLFQA